MGRAIGIDLGSKRIGVALSDEGALIAQPFAVINRKGGLADLTVLARLVTERAISTVVIGLPLNPEPPRPEESEGRAAKAARAFAARLQAHLSDVALGHVAVELVDESFTTVEATDALLAADVSRARRKAVVDKVAAALLLQRWLDAQRNPAARPELGP